MVFRRQWLLIFCALILGGGPLLAAPTREERAFAAATAALHDGIYDRAEAGFAQFIEDYESSPNVPMAVLLEAQAQYKQGKFMAAIDSLAAEHGNVGNLADRYAYWLGEARFGRKDFDGAATAFTNLVNNFPDSSLRLTAAVEAASAFEQSGNWPQIIEFLEATNGAFSRAAELDGANELVSRGRLLLAQAQLAQTNYAAALATLRLLAAQPLTPDLDWQRANLLCHVELAADDLKAASSSATNLVQIARLQKDAGRLADSVALLGTVYERMERWAEAASAWSQNFTNTAPPERQSEAILKMAHAALVQTNFADAETALGNFLAQSSNSPVADLALLTLGELQLKDFVASPSPTNQLALALVNFDRLIALSTNGPLSGKAFLDRGWCHWLAGETTASAADFHAASALLPVSEDLAVAKFKAGDALFRLNDYAGARQNYQAVLDQFENIPAVVKSLGDRALYQILQADMKLTDAAGADAAMKELLKKFPTSELRDHSLLLLAEGFSDWGMATNAFQAFQDFTRLFPDSPLKPQVELAKARTFEREQNWAAAIADYKGWLQDFPTNEFRPQAEYALAWANFQAGNETNAFAQFTNFVARFPGNDLAPLAQWWVADHYFRAADFSDAERNYENIFQNTNATWKNSPLFYHAQLMAGRAAAERLGFADAKNHLTQLIGDAGCPPPLKTQARFAYGGMLMRWDSSDTNRPFANFEAATNVFLQVSRDNLTNELGVLAGIELGDCNLQLGLLDAAGILYAQAMNSPYAGVTLRSQAKVSLGLVQEKQAQLLPPDARTALLKSAFDNYCDVLYTTNDVADPFWFKKAGLQALPLMMTLKDGSVDKFFASLEYWLPQLKDTLEKKRAALNN